MSACFAFSATPPKTPGVQVALAGADANVEVRDIPRVATSKAGTSRGGPCPPSKMIAGVGAAVVVGEEVDDRVAADLLLAVAATRTLTGSAPSAASSSRRLQQQVELALVVGDAARVEPLVADLGLERRALPHVERVGRLDVEVAVDHDRRRRSALCEAGISPITSGRPFRSSSSALAAGAARRSRRPTRAARAHVAGARPGRRSRSGCAGARRARPARPGPRRRSLRGCGAGAASWPQAAAMSRPRVSRTVAGRPGCVEHGLERVDRPPRRAVERAGRVVRDQVDLEDVPVEQRRRAAAPARRGR